MGRASVLLVVILTGLIGLGAPAGARAAESPPAEKRLRELLAAIESNDPAKAEQFINGWSF